VQRPEHPVAVGVERGAVGLDQTAEGIPVTAAGGFERALLVRV
jgi:hypothetical protein